MVYVSDTPFEQWGNRYKKVVTVPHVGAWHSMITKAAYLEDSNVYTHSLLLLMAIENRTIGFYCMEEMDGSVSFYTHKNARLPDPILHMCKLYSRVRKETLNQLKK